MDEIIPLYTDFLKAFDKVPHSEFLKKIAKMGVGGCLLQVSDEHQKYRKEFVRIDIVSSQTLDVTSGVPLAPFWVH